MAISATAISSSAPTACARCWTGSSRISAIPMEDLGLDLRQFLALWRDRQAGRRLWLARGVVRRLRGSGPPVDPDRVMFWEVMGTLRWGVMCCGMMQRFRTGPDHSMERAMIGRRSSETEIDLLRLLAPRGRGEMQDEPTPTELIKAVADFLRNEIAPRSRAQRLQAARRDQRARSGDAATGAGAGQRCGGSRAADAAARHARAR